MKVKDLVRDELIGLYIKVVHSSNNANIGIQGKIVDESKHTIIIEHDGSKKRLFKNNIKLNFYVDDNIIPVNGKLLIGRSKDRVKIRRIK